MSAMKRKKSWLWVISAFLLRENVVRWGSTV